MADTQNYRRGLTHQEAIDLVLGYFLECWAKISYNEGEGDQASFYDNPLHFDNVKMGTIIVSRGADDSYPPADPFDRELEFNGVSFRYGIKQIEPLLGTSGGGDSKVVGELVVKHSGSFQDTLGGRGNRSFVRNGVLAIKLHTNLQKGLTELYKYVNIIAECFEGRQTNSSLWFQSVEINEGGVDGTSYKSEVIVAFQYDQVK